MTAVRMMQTPVHQVVRVVAVWDRFVSAARPVDVTGAGNVRRTTHGIGSINRYGVLIDIYIPQRGFRFVIEVKRLQDEWSDEALQPFLRQTTAYQQTDVRLGFLAVLDLSDRPAGIPHMDECVFLRTRIASPSDRRHAVVMRVPGNRRTPSDHWTPSQSTPTANAVIARLRRRRFSALL
jgi:hypothetical protein